MDDSDACRAQRAFLGDELLRMLLILRLFAEEGVETALRTLPAIVYKTIEIPCDMRDKSRVLSALLSETSPSVQGGLERRQSTACAHLKPDPVLPLLRITAYARSAETADELCDFFDQGIRKALHRPGKNGSDRMNGSS